jgi:hypothetical protein
MDDMVAGLILPATLTTIGPQTFAIANNGLRSITIPAGVSFIGVEAFYLSSNLTRVTFEGNLATVGNDAFPAGENFKTLYDAQETKAGTYVRTGAAWNKEE